MKKNNLIRFVQSLVLLPVMTISLPVGGMHNTGITQNILAKQFNISPVRDREGSQRASISNGIEADQNAKILQTKADAIDTYFANRGMPLKGTGMKMVLEAEKNDLDWRLIPAIAVRESTGGKHDCKNVTHNPFGWGSCKIGFKSDEAAIETIAHNLGGNNPKTAQHYHKKTTKEILNAYNPPSIIPKYTDQVISIMNRIGEADPVILAVAANS